MDPLSWQLLDAGPIALDGGSMFGVVPRAVWAKSVPADDRNRIALGHNCLLISHPTCGPVIIESGSGNKFDAKSRDLFGLSDRWLGTALGERGVNVADVRHAVVTHLHFDHAGGLTTLAEPTGKPDAAAGRAEPAIRPTFPNAVIHVQRQEWEDALANRSVMTRTYLPENLAPLATHVKLHESPAPFSPGATVSRGDRPPGPLEDRLSEVLPGVFVFRVPGHTWGQQAVMFSDQNGDTVVFTPDVLPTAAHLGAAYSMAYDVEPYVSMITKQWFLELAAERNWLLVLDHEPNTPVGRVRQNGKGWFEFIAGR